jgi:outer membrane protein OmpA-like peptidoglycan-associated protein
MKRLITLALIIVLIPLGAHSQNAAWYFMTGPHFVDYYAPDGGGYLATENWNGDAMPKQFYVGRSLIHGLELGTSLSLLDIQDFPGELVNNNFLDWDLMISYKPLYKKVIDKGHWFDPYLWVGPGINRINEETNPLVNVGVGIDFWLNEWVAFNLHTAYDAVMGDGKAYTHHGTGIKFRIAGLKDRDGDGIADKDDLCPDVFGLATLKGCPDKDGDGITDLQDACPDIAGLESLKGCPDSDGDGIADKDDDCPKAKGLAAFKGCPDTDGDGIADKDDDCPQVAGLAALKGCPDRDGDGIADTKDNCPDQAGPVATQGCPDRDGDGIADANDKCPDVKGILKNQGCPEITAEKKKEIEEEIRFSAKNIQFETASDVIRQVSYKDLDNIVNIMNRFPSSTFDIEGHTDDRGNDAMNLDLSKRRAASVKAYFIGKGIDASRLFSEGYGETRPIAPNAKAEGRTQNRRVEISLRGN